MTTYYKETIKFSCCIEALRFREDLSTDKLYTFTAQLEPHVIDVLIDKVASGLNVNIKDSKYVTIGQKEATDNSIDSPICISVDYKTSTVVKHEPVLEYIFQLGLLKERQLVLNKRYPLYIFNGIDLKYRSLCSLTFNNVTVSFRNIEHNTECAIYYESLSTISTPRLIITDIY